jgi:glycosyltransferase involved in cell wall biosynthesis
MIKNLLIVTPTYWPEGSGGTLATHLIIKLLSQTGRFDLTVLTGTRNPEVVPGVRFIVDPFVRFLEKRFSIPRLVENRYGNLVEKYDVVYAVYAYTFIPVAKKLGKRVIVHLHDYRPISPSSIILANQADNPTMLRLIIESFKVKYLERRNIKPVFLNIGDAVRTPLLAEWVSEADTVIAVSKRHAELLAKALPTIRNKLLVVYNPPPPVPRIKKEPANTPTFLYLGGESYIKGFYVLMQAVKTFLKEGYKARFIFAGKYAPRSLKKFERINKLYGNSLHVIGYVSHERTILLYREAWSLIFPSICEEPLPYVVLESLLTRTIPIASAVGGVPELFTLSELTRFLFKPGDFRSLYEKILGISMLTNKELLELISIMDNYGYLPYNISLENLVNELN